MDSVALQRIRNEIDGSAEILTDELRFPDVLPSREVVQNVVARLENASVLLGTCIDVVTISTQSQSSTLAPNPEDGS